MDAFNKEDSRPIRTDTSRTELSRQKVPPSPEDREKPMTDTASTWLKLRTPLTPPSTIATSAVPVISAGMTHITLLVCGTVTAILALGDNAVMTARATSGGHFVVIHTNSIPAVEITVTHAAII